MAATSLDLLYCIFAATPSFVDLKFSLKYFFK